MIKKQIKAAFHGMLLRGLQPERLPHIKRPEDVGVPRQSVQEVTLNAVDGAALFAWFIRPDDTPSRGAPALIALHGWGSNAGDLLSETEAVRRSGHALLLLDARCHGLSGDAEFTSMPRFAEDLGSAMDWLKSQPGIDPERITLIGHSVGGAAALLLASRRQDVRGVIGLSVFAHPADMMRRWVRAHHIPMWPLGHWTLEHVQEVIGHRFDDIAPEHTLKRVRAPVLLIHGQLDEVAPIGDLHRLCAAAHRSDVTTLVLPGVGHDISQARDQTVVASVLNFLKG
jgi:uncharacterized protein